MFYCPERSGRCPTENSEQIYASEYPTGMADCVFDEIPKVMCSINGSAECEYSKTCPNVGDTVTMARSVADGTLTCAKGAWNTCRVTIRYDSPETSASRTQTSRCR